MMYIGNYKLPEGKQPSIKMDNLMLKFPHLPEQIFQKLNNESLFKSRKVARSWKYLINERNYLWIRKVNIPTILQRSNTYLHLAAQTGKIDAFKTALSDEEDTNIKNIFDYTPFHHACQYGRSKIVELLIKDTDLNIEFNAKDTAGRTALILACFNRHSDVVKIIMENSINLGIDLNAKEICLGNTAFMAACQQGCIDVVKIFMKNATILSIDLNAKNYKGLTGFHMACQKSFMDMVKLFMVNAAILRIDLNAKDERIGCTGFHWACWGSHLDRLESLDSENVQEVDNFNVSKTIKKELGETTYWNHSNVVELFMYNAATLSINLNAIDKTGQTAFHLASRYGRSNVVKLFMENSATLSIDLNAIDNTGQTAFHLACRYSHCNVVKLFMENSATFSIDLNAKDNNGETAYYLACRNGRFNVVKLFMKNAANIHPVLSSRVFLGLAKIRRNQIHST